MNMNALLQHKGHAPRFEVTDDHLRVRMFRRPRPLD